MLAITTWLWGDKYSAQDVRKLARGIARNLEQPYRFIVFTDRAREFDAGDDFLIARIPPADLPLTKIRGCFARLRLFDPSFQESINIVGGGRIRRIANMDLDSVVTGKLDPLFNRAEGFAILRGANASNPCPYNGSLWMLRMGFRPDVWSEFSLDQLDAIPQYEFPDDQGWFWLKFGDNAPGWEVGPRSGVYAFQKPGWPQVELQEIGKPERKLLDGGLPADARLVVFPGWRSPDKFLELPWVREHWK